MTMDKDGLFELRRLIGISDVFQKFTQQIGILTQAFGVFIIGKQVEELVTKHCDTTRLQPNHRNASFNLGTQRVENLSQQLLSYVEHAKVIEGTTATQGAGRQQDLIACVFQHLDRRLTDLREEV